MKKIFIRCLLVCFTILNICGCAPLLVGMAAGGVAIYAAGKDSVQGETDKPYEGLWRAALEVSKSRGIIRQEDQARGYIELDADSSKVHIRLTRMTRATTRLRISARRYSLPNLSLAQDIFVKITERAQ